MRKKCMKLSAGPLQIHLSPCIDDVQWLCAFIHSLLQADNQVRNKSLKHITFYMELSQNTVWVGCVKDEYTIHVNSLNVKLDEPN